MTPLDIVIICVVAVAFVAVMGVIIYKKVNHKGGCDCGCSNCPHCYNCKQQNKNKENT
ncbi:MAG: FeoB-associated Cys-rich membrane protein [Candidatus Coproplasma sp.]